MSARASFQTEGVYVPDFLVAGNSHLILVRQLMVAAGQNLQRGAVVGKITNEEHADFGKLVLSLAAATDGSAEVFGILADDCDAQEGAKPALAYVRGDFAAQALVLGDGHTLASITEAFRPLGISILSIME